MEKMSLLQHGNDADKKNQHPPPNSTPMQTLARHHLRPLSTPPAPRGHHSHISNLDSLATLAILASDPLQPRYIRRFHRSALEGSLASLACAVLSVSAR